MAKNFIVISGGPGLYQPCDKKNHDTGWSNYLDNILLLAANNKFPIQRDEMVWWFVYKPSYEERWNDDIINKRKSVDDIKKKGSNSYVHHIERRALKYHWNLHWITEADGLWKKSITFRDKISRIWYFGHARQDLWLSLLHDNCDAIEPIRKAIIYRSQIRLHSKLKSKFLNSSSYDENSSSRFYGCNTSKFAEQFSKTFGVYAEGAEGTVDFQKTHSSSGDLRSIISGCTWIKYNPTGIKI